MVLGSSTAAFAHGNDKDRDKDRKDNDRNERSSIQTKYTPKSANLEIKLTFDDLRGKDVEWAARYIASLASKKVFEGYEDGTFQPRKTISRIERLPPPSG